MTGQHSTAQQPVQGSVAHGHGPSRTRPLPEERLTVTWRGGKGHLGHGNSCRPLEVLRLRACAIACTLALNRQIIVETHSWTGRRIRPGGQNGCEPKSSTAMRDGQAVDLFPGTHLHDPPAVEWTNGAAHMPAIPEHHLQACPSPNLPNGAVHLGRKVGCLSAVHGGHARRELSFLGLNRISG